ncbi:MAG: transglycosylase SLT domain-containing protein, partial [Syntrophaceticus schinkii]|nr:transglycosylase SLT domain-containing protein [Syntrophaceticus schinkii]
RTLGWDWRVLRAVMYQESKYRMNAYSGSNAIGLMQIKEFTAIFILKNCIFLIRKAGTQLVCFMIAIGVR